MTSYKMVTFSIIKQKIFVRFSFTYTLVGSYVVYFGAAHRRQRRAWTERKINNVLPQPSIRPPHLANETGNCCGRPGRAALARRRRMTPERSEFFATRFFFFPDSSPGGWKSFEQSAVIVNAQVTLLSVLKPSFQTLE